jgi:two-component system CheB/CheR fusion protein
MSKETPPRADDNAARAPGARRPAADGDSARRSMRPAPNAAMLVIDRGERDGATPAARPEGREPRIVCLGASAGGLEAMEIFFRAIPPDTGAAFVAILHLAGDFKNVMAELLARYTKMRIEPVVSGSALAPNTVYVIPPNKNLLYREGRLVLQEQDRTTGRGVNFPIDVFLESLAAERQTDAIALILSGTGTDGSRGIRALKAAGGVVLVQAPDSAKFDAMPRSALQTDAHDGTGSAEGLAIRVAELVSRAHPPASADATEVSEAAVRDGLASLQRHFAMDFGYLRPQMIRRRMERRMQLVGVASLERYAELLASSADEARELRQDLLIGVTAFFRDPEAYEVLRRQLLRYVGAMRAGDTFRAWVPACATGEEAYSIAMLVVEVMEAAGAQLDVKIFATDVDEEALAQAARAQYPISNSKDLSNTRLARFFQSDGDFLTLKPAVREMVICARHDLVSDPPFKLLDLVACRNFLIHATPKRQSEVLSDLHFALKPDGLLLLGITENLGEVEREFEPIAADQRLFKKLTKALTSNVLKRVTPSIARGEAERDDGIRQVFELLAEERGSTIVTASYDGTLLEVFADELGVFRLPKGKPSTDLVRMADKEIAGPLRAAWHRAKNGQDTINQVTEYPPDSGRRVALSARRVPASGSLSERILITLEPRTESEPFRELHPERADAELERLHDELQQVREGLQTAMDELDRSEADHQATQQELAAALEELQSTNEELVTVNAEHQKKVQELAQQSADMQALLRSVNVGMLFLDDSLRIRRFAAGPEEIVKLMDRDIGRPIEHVAHQFGPDFVEVLKEVVLTRATQERQLRSPQGKWLGVRVEPHTSANGQPDGLVVTTMDVTAITNAQQLNRLSTSQLSDVNKELTRRGEELEDLFSIVAHDLKRPVIALDGLLQLANDDLSLSVDDARLFIGRAKTECARMRRMLEDLGKLSSTSRREVSLEEVDLQPWLDSVLGRFAEAASERGVRLNAVCDSVQLTLPQAALEEAVENLVENAFKYGCTDASPRIDVSCRFAKGVLEIVVMDNGKGIPRESHEKVFEPFRRLQPDIAEGSGMGLVAVRRALGRHGGVVAIDAQAEKGAKFVMRLPLGGAPLDVETVSGKRRILVVEDDALDYKMIERLLGEQFEVTRAHQLTDAELRLSEDPYHMVLLDLSLPDGHGLELVKRMRALLERPVPVVVVTGHGEGITSESLGTGLISGWVAKSQLTKETLHETMERVLAA